MSSLSLSVSWSLSLGLSLSPSSLWVQPSSPGDYHNERESDLNVELTEKLFALDTEGPKSPGSTQVSLTGTSQTHY